MKYKSKYILSIITIATFAFEIHAQQMPDKLVKERESNVPIRLAETEEREAIVRSALNYRREAIEELMKDTTRVLKLQERIARLKELQYERKAEIRRVLTAEEKRRLRDYSRDLNKSMPH